MLNISVADSEFFTIYLTFSSSSNPSYRFFPNVKRPPNATAKNQYSRLERNLVDLVLNSFSVHYIPSDKSTEQLYNDLVLPVLLRKALDAVRPHVALIQGAMEEASLSLNASLAAAGLTGVESAFAFPPEASRFFRDVDFSLSDPNSTSIFNKGMGIQSAALLAAFNWITQEEILSRKNVLWLLEEPESYLHPELASQCNRLIDELRTRSQVVCTTHSLGFVPQDPARIVGVTRENGWTKTHNFKTYHEATNRIRTSLGVRFSDFYNLDHFNVLVEGETDREYLQYFAKLLTRHSLAPVYPILTSDLVSFLDQGGVSGLQGFVRATYNFIRTERPCVIMVDGDSAGDKCRRDLQAYLGQKNIPFEANKHFIVVRDRFTIEGLFPDSWVKELHERHPTWLEGYSVDASGTLLPFTVDDARKRQFMGWMRAKANEEPDLTWAERWTSFLAVLEAALRKEALRVYGGEAEVAQILAISRAGQTTQSLREIEALLTEPTLNPIQEGGSAD